MSGFHLHHASTAAWIAVILIAAGFAVGYWVGVRTAPSHYDAKIIEHRLREVFCEQALLNNMMKAPCTITRGTE